MPAVDFQTNETSTANEDSESIVNTERLFESFEKIRVHVRSGLENQRQPAVLLAAIEDAIREQDKSLTKDDKINPVAYFGSLFTMLETKLDEMSRGLVDTESSLTLLTSFCYLLQFVMQNTPSSLLRLKVQNFSKCFSIIFEHFLNEQPLIRAVIGCIEPLLGAQYIGAWQSDVSVKTLFMSILKLSVDGRAKMRKRAEQAISTLLSNPPPPSVCHPATPISIDFYIRGITEFKKLTSTLSSGKERKELEQDILHILVSLKELMPVLAMQGTHEKISDRLQKLVELLLSIPQQSTNAGNLILTQWIFNVLEGLFSATSFKAEEGCFPDLSLTLIDTIIKTLLDIKPYRNDIKSTTSWLQLINTGIVRVSLLVNQTVVNNANTETASIVIPSEIDYTCNKYPQLLSKVFISTFEDIIQRYDMNSQLSSVCSSVFSSMIWSISLGMISNADDGLLHQCDDSLIESMISVVVETLSDVRYRDSWDVVFVVIEAIFGRIGYYRADLVQPLIVMIKDIRDSPSYIKDFAHKKELESCFVAIINSIGLDAFLTEIPLNIMNEFPNQPRRPYMLTTITDALKRPAPRLPALSIEECQEGKERRATFGKHTLKYAADQLLNQSQTLFERSSGFNKEGKALQAKLFETLGLQSWGILTFVCASKPNDVVDGFPLLAPTLLKILNTPKEELFAGLPSNPDFKPTCCEMICSLLDCYDITKFNNKIAELGKDINMESSTLLYKRNELNKNQLVILEGNAQLKQYSNKFLTTICHNSISVNKDFVINEVVTKSKKKTNEDSMDIAEEEDYSKSPRINVSAKSLTLQQLQDKERVYYKKAIEALLKTSDKMPIRSYFMGLIKKLLQVQSQSKKLEEDAYQDRLAIREISKSADSSKLKEVSIRITERYPDQVMAKLVLYSILDLLTVILPSTELESTEDDSSCLILFFKVLVGQLSDRDSTIQKKSYKGLDILIPMLPDFFINENIETLCTKIIEPDVVSRVNGGSKGRRVALIGSVVKVLFNVYNSSEEQDKEKAKDIIIQFVMITLPETMLATKEASEKTRDSAYSCILQIANFMKEAGSGNEKGLWDMNAFNESDLTEEENVRTNASLSLREFMMMVVAGLAGSTNDMQSSTISTISRLIYEFHTSMDDQLINELIETVMYLMDTKNKEIIKSGLGFIKVIIVCLEPEQIASFLEPIVVKIIQQSRDNRSHFRVKVRHILERLVRKFSFEAVEGFVEESDKKLINNIRKKRDRAKKLKEKANEMEEDKSSVQKKPIAKKKEEGGKYEDVLHDSDSELGSDDEDEGNNEERYIPKDFRDVRRSNIKNKNDVMLRETTTNKFEKRDKPNRYKNKVSKGESQFSLSKVKASNVGKSNNASMTKRNKKTSVKDDDINIVNFLDSKTMANSVSSNSVRKNKNKN